MIMDTPRMNLFQRIGVWMSNLQDRMRYDWVEAQERTNPNILKHTREIQRLGRQINDWSEERAARDPVFKAHRDRLRAEYGITEEDIEVAINRGNKSVR